MSPLRVLRRTLCGMSLCVAIGASVVAQAKAPAAGHTPATPIRHFITLMQENHTFDNYFGTYPGVDGLVPGTCVPVDLFNPKNTSCVRPYHIGYRPIRDLEHDDSTARIQYNGGRMDGFVYALLHRNIDPAVAMGYYDGSDLPYYWSLVKQYVLFDRFFSSTLSGSFTNHLYWVAAAEAATPVVHCVSTHRSRKQASGNHPRVICRVRKAMATTQDYRNLTTIFDRLQASGISWKFYVQHYDPHLTYRTLSGQSGNRLSQVVWVPLLNIDRFIDQPALSRHIVDFSQYFQDLHNNTLPAVAYIVPSGASEHPPGSIQTGQRFVKTAIQELMRSAAWRSSALLVSYDDWGGWYDHVPPPQVDKYGYGFRVPAFLVSPYARTGYIDRTTLDFTSILRFIEDNWHLKSLSTRDAAAKSLVGAFDFHQVPRKASFIPVAGDSINLLHGPRREVLYGAYGAALALAGLLFARAAITPARRRRRSRKASSSLGSGGSAK